MVTDMTQQEPHPLRVLVTPEGIRHCNGPHLAVLRNAGFEVRYPRDPGFTRGLSSEAETIEELSVANALIAGGELITADVLDAVPNLRIIARLGVGYDSVDIPAATERGVPVTVTPTTIQDAVAEHTLALLFAVVKRLTFADRRLRDGQWPRELIGPIRGNTIGIVGFGRIGRATAVRARALGMTVLTCDVNPDAQVASEIGVELVDFETLLGRSDIVSIHCPLADTTRGLFNKRVFAKMKRGSYLINTARGPIVVESDLVEALREGHLAGAALDVFEAEPTPTDNPLFDFDNVVLTPHSAGWDAQAQRDAAAEAAECIAKLRRGEWPEGAVVNDVLRSTWRWER